LQPVFWRLQIPSTHFAPQDGHLFLNTLCYIHLVSNTVYAHIGRIRRYWYTTQATEPAAKQTNTQSYIYPCVCNHYALASTILFIN
jgi:hypothetical protein